MLFASVGTESVLGQWRRGRGTWAEVFGVQGLGLRGAGADIDLVPWPLCRGRH
jgi:hypothetical protein